MYAGGGLDFPTFHIQAISMLARATFFHVVFPDWTERRRDRRRDTRLDALHFQVHAMVGTFVFLMLSLMKYK